MKVDITSMFFNSSIEGQTATPAWRTSLGQNKTKECRIETDVPGVIDIVVGMTYKIVGDISKLNMTGISGSLLMCSVFDKIYVNSVLLPDSSYTLLLLRETSQSHEGRVQLCYSPHIVFDGKRNAETIDKIRAAIGCEPQGCWFVHDISIKNQDELHFLAKVVDSEKPKVYSGKSQQRSQEWKDLVNTPTYTIDELASILRDLYEEGKKVGEGVANIFFFGLKYAECILNNNYKTKEIVQKSAIGESFQAELDKAIKLYTLLQRKGWASVRNKVTSASISKTDNSSYLQYLTALRTKPFMLLAGISGTGKSRIVKELAFMTCPNKEGYNNDKTTPGNYCLIEVKPNWHDSSELLGYYNALDGKYELTPFIRFAYRALQRADIPFFVCLDEMNLAPVEQYFAEYLSVLETRTKDGEEIISAKLIKKEAFNGIDVAQKYKDDDIAIAQYLQENGLPLPSNLYIIGTVNMDDTTHQFSRKVIDRAFTIEMNGGKLEDMFKPENANALQYRDEVVSIDQLKSHFVNAEEVFKDGESDTLWTQYETKIKTDVQRGSKPLMTY